MKELLVTISKSSVYEEVAKTTAYIGAKSKLEDGKTAFDQIFVTDADLSMIERFYRESVDTLKNVLKRFISGINDEDDGLTLTLEMPDRFDENMGNSINSSSTSFLVDSIIGKWCEITANEKVKEYTDNAMALLQDIKDKVFYRSKPIRIAPNK